MTGQIKPFQLTRLSNDEAFGFLNDVYHQVLDTFSDIPTYADVFISGFAKFGSALKKEGVAVSGKDLEAADNEADQAWWALNAYLKAMISHPNLDKRKAAQAIYDVFTQYENPTALAYSTEYGILERLIWALNGIDSDIVQKADAEEWIKHLDEKRIAFMTLYSTRVQDNAAKELGATKKARLDAIDSYKRLTATVNALVLVSPTDELNDFVAHVNKLISARNVTLKSRKTRQTQTEESAPEA